MCLIVAISVSRPLFFMKWLKRARWKTTFPLKGSVSHFLVGNAADCGSRVLWGVKGLRRKEMQVLCTGVALTGASGQWRVKNRCIAPYNSVAVGLFRDYWSLAVAPVRVVFGKATKL